MKRLHVSLAVKDLAESVRFYSTLFATKPTVLKTDYAKWMLDDPRVNFSISARGEDRGFDRYSRRVLHLRLAHRRFNIHSRRHANAAVPSALDLRTEIPT